MPENRVPTNDQARRRWTVYWLLIALAVGQMTGRLMAVNSVNVARLERNRIEEKVSDYSRSLEDQGITGEEAQERIGRRRQELAQELRLQRPFLSANDRSRWLAIRALVEHGTYEIDAVLQEPNWDTIDMVQHPNRAGEPRQYSSKPPLLYTLLAAEYWLIHKTTGRTLGTHPYTIGRAMLVTINIVPLALMMALVAAVVERLFDSLPGEAAATDWPRYFVVSSATFGTLLTPFSVVLNNHIVAAVSASVAIYCWARIRLQDDPRWRWFVLGGLAAAFTAANELPALAMLVALGGLLLARHPRRTMLGFAPGALVVVAAFFTTNYIAHDSLRPPYMHRSETDAADNWYDYTYNQRGRERESYWNNRKGIDLGEGSQKTYALHTLVGHHGLFSLTPIWFLSLAGAGYWLVRGRPEERELAALVLALSIICLTFFIGFREQHDRNYGGMTAGFRWMFWFAPLWLLVMTPAVAGLSRWRMGRAFALALLAWSAFSTTYPTWNPWTQPWIYQALEASGWQGF